MPPRVHLPKYWTAECRSSDLHRLVGHRIPKYKTGYSNYQRFSFLDAGLYLGEPLLLLLCGDPTVLDETGTRHGGADGQLITYLHRARRRRCTCGRGRRRPRSTGARSPRTPRSWLLPSIASVRTPKSPFRIPRPPIERRRNRRGGFGPGDLARGGFDGSFDF